MSERKQFGCSQCGKTYNCNKNLRQHVSKTHPGKLDAIAPLLRSTQSYAYTCEICNKNFNHEYNFTRHQRNYHGLGKKSLKCSMCDYEGTTENSLNEHLELVHETCVKSEELEFSSFDDFKIWKRETEAATRSCFVKMHGSHTAADNTIRHSYVCHRSGNFVSKSKGVRRLKKQGSNKIGVICPSKIRVIEDQQGVCKVKFVSTHIGHQHELAHLGLTEKERNSIAADIANKIPFQAILDKIRDSTSACNLERIHLLTKQDLYNIERCYNLCSTSVRHQNDGTSVEALVYEMNSNDNPCVLFYKPQDMMSESHPELKTTDFVLIIMNNAQCEILKKFGNDCICIDRTQGINSYGFELMTILVLDDVKQGFPCAFFISNRNDWQVLAIFFHYIKSKVGKLFPKVFMSDLEESFFNAWISTMETPEMKLYCTWLVDEAWRKNIKSRIQGQEKRADVYKLLRTLLEERNAAAFETMLDDVLETLKSDPDTSEFASYFQDYYMSNVKCWAYCYRLHAGFDRNMHIERMHRTLKYIYLHRKQVKCLDKAIFALMSFIKVKLFNRFIVLTRDKLTSKMEDILHRHKSSLQIDRKLIVKEDSGWKIPSSSKVTEMYFVQDNEVQCTCRLICSECNTCIHRYSCTCVDSSIKWNMCEHIHCICQILLNQELALKHPEDSNELVVDCELVVDYEVVIDCEDVCIVDENHQILEQVTQEEDCQTFASLSQEEDCQTFASLSQEKDTIVAELLDLARGISTKREFEVLEEHVASLKVNLAAVRNK